MKDKKDKKRILREHGHTNGLAFTLIVMITIWGCSEGDGPGSGEEVGVGQAKVKFSMGGINYAGDDVGTRGGGEPGEPEMVLVPLGDGENLLECTLAREPRTRAGNEIAMAEGTAVRVYVYEGNTYVRDSVIHAGSTTETITLDAGKTYTIRAVSYNNTTEPPSVTGDLNTTSASLAATPGKDLLYAAATLETHPGVNNKELTFKHKFSRVRVTANSSAMSADITACTATLTPGKSATLDLTDGTVSETTPDVPQTLTWPAGSNGLPGMVVTSKDTTVYTGTATTLTLTFDITVGTAPAYTGKTVTFEGPLAAANRYTVTVNFKAGIPSTPGTIGGVYWAKANLYETAASTTANPQYALFANEYDYSGVYTGGDYWNWGAVNPRTNTTDYYDGSHPNSVDWSATPSAATDPCYKALGNSWRLPTQSELNDLKTTHAGFDNYSTTTNVKGMWFGTSTVPTVAADQAQYVFLPAAGTRTSGGTDVHGMDEAGTYWAMERVQDDQHAAMLFIDQYSVYVDKDFTGTGFTVRCVREAN